jgi:8-oxo-dGTP pyrophosphatase MutT (NUDIX family)
MNILGTNVLARGMSADGRRCWLAMHELVMEDAGKERKYFFVTRGDVVVPPHEKKPDAVVIIAFTGEGEDQKMVLTSEYRVVIGSREIGTPAGLIDAADYEGCSPITLCGSKKVDTVAAAACRAAIREFKEETGMDFTPTEVSPDNLYCTAGMTNESICIVIGKASGTPSKEFLEEHEDINTMMLNREEIMALMESHDLPIAKHVWPFLWSIKQFGFPKI